MSERSHLQVVAEPQPEYVGFPGCPTPITVDAGIHDLLQRLWQHGYRTQFSCQGQTLRDSYILFADIEDGIRFFAETAKHASLKGFMPRLKLETFVNQHGNRSRISWPTDDLSGVKSAWEVS